MNRIIVYDNCQQDAWNSKIAPSINPVPADAYYAYPTPDGLLALNSSSKEMGGGLVSTDYPVPAGCKFFGMDVNYTISAADLGHLARNEMDLKITLASGSAAAIPNQANGSAQHNASKGWVWQLDPDGKGWVDSGYAPGPPEPDIPNTMHFRYWSDGVKWSVTSLRQNGGDPFTPGPAFQNLPMITTNWGAGLHPQLQMECAGAPWFLRQTYDRVRIIASDAAIPWNLA